MIQRFKEYLNEDSTSRSILSWMTSWRIPLSPKFMATIFPENNDVTCFRAVPPGRIETLKKREKSKNQVSTFTNFSDSSIFYGAGSFQWKDQYEGLTTVAILRGRVTIKGTVDLWTFPDASGRRWIDVKSISKYNVSFTDALVTIQDEIKKQFPKNLEKSDLVYHVTPKGNIKWDTNEDKNIKIKIYIDTAYAAIKKYKNLIRKTSNQLEGNHYNEYPCYDYKIEKVLVLVPPKLNTPEKVELLKYLEKNRIPFEVVSDTQALEKVLKSYK